ncbi:helix-turn-helix domain-containing protein [Saccharomonospora sp. NPDC006951]
MSPRADAVRNRTKVLAAADEVFAELGTDASTDEVARRAGVGIGTVFRHFPTKEALLASVFQERLRQVGNEAAAMATSDDPAEAFHELFTKLIGNSRTKQALGEALTAAGIDIDDAIAPVRDEVREAIAILLAKAQEAGGVRGDIGVDEAIALLIGASQASAAVIDISMRARTLNVFLDGLRP